MLDKRETKTSKWKGYIGSLIKQPGIYIRSHVYKCIFGNHQYIDGMKAMRLDMIVKKVIFDREMEWSKD